MNIVINIQGGAAPTDGTPWDVALQSVQNCHSAMDTFRFQMLVPADAAYYRGEITLEQIHATEREYIMSYTEPYGRAVSALMRTPAPNLKALAKKLELGIGEVSFDSDGNSHDELEAILEDVRRIGGLQRSRGDA